MGFKWKNIRLTFQEVTGCTEQSMREKEAWMQFTLELVALFTRY